LLDEWLCDTTLLVSREHPFQTADGPVDVAVFDGRTAHGARRSSVSLAPEVVELAEQGLAASDATALTAPPAHTGMEQRRRW